MGGGDACVARAAWWCEPTPPRATQASKVPALHPTQPPPLRAILSRRSSLDAYGRNKSGPYAYGTLYFLE